MESLCIYRGVVIILLIDANLIQGANNFQNISPDGYSIRPRVMQQASVTLHILDGIIPPNESTLVQKFLQENPKTYITMNFMLPKVNFFYLCSFEFHAYVTYQSRPLPIRRVCVECLGGLTGRLHGQLEDACQEASGSGHIPLLVHNIVESLYQGQYLWRNEVLCCWSVWTHVGSGRRLDSLSPQSF